MLRLFALGGSEKTAKAYQNLHKQYPPAVHTHTPLLTSDDGCHSIMPPHHNLSYLIFAQAWGQTKKPAVNLVGPSKRHVRATTCYVNEDVKLGHGMSDDQ